MKFNDGTPILKGFAVSEKPVIQDVWYVLNNHWTIRRSSSFPTSILRFQLPKVPDDWSPNPRRVWEQNKENFEGAQQELEPLATKRVQGSRANPLTANQVNIFHTIC